VSERRRERERERKIEHIVLPIVYYKKPATKIKAAKSCTIYRLVQYKWNLRVNKERERETIGRERERETIEREREKR
jgi:hypothetical protein